MAENCMKVRIADGADCKPALRVEVANMKGVWPALVAGSAQSLVGPKAAAGPAVALAAPATGAAILDTIKGRTLVWNQLAEPLNRTLRGITATTDAATGIITFSGAGDGGAGSIQFFLSLGFKSGHKYYIKFEDLDNSGITVANGTGDTQVPWLFSSNMSFGTPASPVPSSGIYTANADVAAGAAIRFTFSQNITQFTYRYRIQIIDITAMFQAGNEPATVAAFEAMFKDFPYASNIGTLLPLRISGLVSIDSDDQELATLYLPVVGKTAKDGYGDTIVPFPAGMHGTPTVYDTATKDGGSIKWGVRAYEAGDESDATVITDGTNTAYPLDTAVDFTWDEPLEMVAPVQAGGALLLQPEGVDEQGIPATAPLSADIKWPFSVSSIDGTLANLLDALKTAGVITAYTMTYNAGTGRYDFTIN